MDKIELNWLFANHFLVVGDETSTEETDTNEEDTSQEEPPAKKPAPKKAPKVEFTSEQQAYLNSLLAEEKRQAKVKIEKHVTQLETEKNKAGTTAAEKVRLEEQIEELRSTYETEKQMTEKDRKKAEKKVKDEIDAAKKDADTWKTRFTKTQIKRALVDASSIPGQKADNPQHIVALLFEDSRLVEETDEDGKPTDNFVTKVKIRSKDKDGKPVTLDMIATDAVKFVSEQDEHARLFESGVSGGLGGNPNRPRKGGVTDPNSPPKDQAAYREWRKANPGAVGAPSRSSGK